MVPPPRGSGNWEPKQLFAACCAWAGGWRQASQAHPWPRTVWPSRFWGGGLLQAQTRQAFQNPQVPQSLPCTRHWAHGAVTCCMPPPLSLPGGSHGVRPCPWALPGALLSATAREGKCSWRPRDENRGCCGLTMKLGPPPQKSQPPVPWAGGHMNGRRGSHSSPALRLPARPQPGRSWPARQPAGFRCRHPAVR